MANAADNRYPPLRIIVLETDQPRLDADGRSLMAELIQDHLSKAGAAHHPPLEVETTTVCVIPEWKGRMPSKDEFDSYDGLVLTGSLYDAFGNDPWILDLLVVLKGRSNPFHTAKCNSSF